MQSKLYWTIQKLFSSLLLILLSLTISGQTQPVDNSRLSELYRDAQLLGKLDSSISSTLLPISPQKIATKANPTLPAFITDNGKFISALKNPLRINQHKGSFFILPLRWRNQWNSNHPYSLNDGALIPARGYQTKLSLGVFFRYGIFSMQLAPEYVYAANKPFKTLSNNMPSPVWDEYNLLHRVIDLPDRFGENPYSQLFPGQSYIRLTAGAVSLGLSTENIWWGPGMRNSLMMSNSAPGFAHITLNTVRPIRTWIGNFEGQLLSGKLENSGFQHQSRQDWRYLNALLISWNPRWTPGLFMGLTRSFIAYFDDLETFTDFMPVITPFAKKSNYGDNESPYPNDQRLSVFGRWSMPKANAEIYAEFFREDHAYDFRDIWLQLEHTHAYLMGVTKLFILKNNQYIRFNTEFTKLEQNSTNSWRPSYYLYSHFAGVYQGYTHKGQMLGPGIGPGSDLWSIGVSWNNGLNKIGLEAERMVHNNDFFNRVIIEPRAKWVDLNFILSGCYNWKSLLFSARAIFQNSYNYQYYYQPVVSSNNADYWAPGTNTFNLQLETEICYRF